LASALVAIALIARADTKKVVLFIYVPSTGFLFWAFDADASDVVASLIEAGFPALLKRMIANCPKRANRELCDCVSSVSLFALFLLRFCRRFIKSF
jgi:hypothetical protein